MESVNLQKTRLARGISQSELSKASGVSLMTLQKYERRALDINGAKLLTLLKLCQALNCRLSDILDDPETVEAIDKYESYK